jgi:hypothetical protein
LRRARTGSALPSLKQTNFPLSNLLLWPLFLRWNLLRSTD